MCLRHSLIQARWSSSARGLSGQCAPSPPPVQNVSPRYHFATRTAAALHAGCWRVHHGAHSIPYYQNALADPHWQQKTARCAESWTERETTLVTASFNNTTMHQPPFLCLCFWLRWGASQTPDPHTSFGPLYRCAKLHFTDLAQTLALAFGYTSSLWDGTEIDTARANL